MAETSANVGRTVRGLGPGGDRFGTHRALEPAGSLPQPAQRLSNDFTRIYAGELLLAPTRKAFTEQLAARGTLPVAPIVAAQLHNTAGLVGAADLARIL